MTKREQDWSSDIKMIFNEVELDESWSFADKTRKDTAYVTHGFHRYPAKFIPQLANRLICKYSRTEDLVVDPFCGCGTTSVESKINGRRSIGVDINPVATMISKAKITAIEPSRLATNVVGLQNKLQSYKVELVKQYPQHSRIDYWFYEDQKMKLAYLLQLINETPDTDIRNFYLCGFSNILKNCSIWLQKSSKPTRDFRKNVSDPFIAFNRHLKVMMRGNNSFFRHLQKDDRFDIQSDIHISDARCLPLESESTMLIVTSPPYVTSYEYADLHQLTAFWFDYTDSLPSFRKKFIGTAHHESKQLNLNSQVAEKIVSQLKANSRKIAIEVQTYFGEMYQVFHEMKRILRGGGKACVVIGNTGLKGVEILNAEVFAEQFLHLGFTVESIIKREIPSKILPSIRDPNTGKFAKSSCNAKVLAYPTEFILVMRKS